MLDSSCSKGCVLPSLWPAALAHRDHSGAVAGWPMVVWRLQKRTRLPAARGASARIEEERQHRLLRWDSEGKLERAS